MLGDRVSVHAFHANTLLTEGAMKTSAESKPNMASAAFLWPSFIIKFCHE